MTRSLFSGVDRQIRERMAHVPLNGAALCGEPSSRDDVLRRPAIALQRDGGADAMCACAAAI
jgi:hypothetical protein